MASVHRVEFSNLFDDETPEHDEVLRAAAAIRPTDRVLDVGCGTGQSTRNAARAANAGSVVGIDISAPLIEHARALTEQDGPANVRYEVADAQTYPFAPEFDVCISSFGVMFFADPAAAFANLARALRPGGRLALLVWAREEDNEWALAMADAFGTRLDPEPFSLGDPDVVRDLLHEFTDVELIGTSAPVHYGPDAATASDFVSGFRDTKQVLATADGETADRIRDRLRTVMQAHTTPAGVRFDARTWVITARR